MIKKLYKKPDLKTFIQKTEDQNFEKKSAKYNPKHLAKYFSAFANSSIEGGLIVVGIKNDTKVVGLQNIGTKRKNKLEQAPKTFCPNAQIEYKTFSTKYNNNKYKFLLFYVHFSRNKVIEKTDGTAYKRVGDETIELLPEEKKLMKQDKGESRFEEEPVPNLKLDDLNKEKIKEFIQGWIDRDALNKKPGIKETILHNNFGKKENKKLQINKAGLLLFHDRPDNFIPGAHIRFLRYKGEEIRTGKKSNIIKDKTFRGAITKQIQDASDMIKNQIKEFSFLQEDGKFTTIPEYPPFAWKELIVNAIAHRSYDIKNENIFIRMFDNKLEVTSPGTLPHIVNEKNIYKKTYPRNPLIMEALLKLGYVKKASEGLDRVRDEMLEMNLPEPELNNDKEAINFTITLYNKINNRKPTDKKKLEEQINKNIRAQLDKDERKIIIFLLRNDTGKTSDFKKEIEKSRPTVRRKIRSLEEKNIISRNKKQGPKVKYILNDRMFSKKEKNTQKKHRKDEGQTDLFKAK